MTTKTRSFEIVAKAAGVKARAGRIKTPHGDILTPVFAPVGTQGSVKALLSQDLEKLNTSLILANAFHLYLRPGVPLIDKAGGLHRFMSWNGPILTDSGGYQVFSMEKLRSVTEEGVEFRSHIDGSLHFLSPEKATEIQLKLGSDIMMCFDECPPFPCTEDHARRALETTFRWARRCQAAAAAAGRDGRMIFAITQGSVFPALRTESARQLVDLDFDGYAIGGLSVGEPHELMHAMVELSTDLLPEEKPRYLMGVGTPLDLWEAIESGIDQFDCVIPTRNGRNGQVFTSVGKLNLKNAPYREDMGPVDPDCDCDLCSRYSRAYIHHLFRSGELSALRLASLHNVAFLIKLMRKIRQYIIDGTFSAEKKRFFEMYNNQGDPK